MPVCRPRAVSARQGGNIQSFLATPTRIYTTVYVYVYVYRYTAYTIYRQHGAKFCQVLSSLPCIRARPYHCISWADSTPTRIYTTLLHYKIYSTLRILQPWILSDSRFGAHPARHPACTLTQAPSTQHLLVELGIPTTRILVVA